MVNYIVVANEAGFAVLDEMDTLVEQFSTEKEARMLARDMNALDREHNAAIDDKQEVAEIIEVAEATQVVDMVDIDLLAGYGLMFFDTVIEEPAQVVEFIEVPTAAQVVEVVTQVIELKSKFKADANGSKAEQVRFRIVQAKQANESKAVVEEWIVTKLGMKRQLARVYTNENWVRV